MNTKEINRALSAGDVVSPGVLPRLEMLGEERFVFRIEFGLDDLPAEPGVIFVRGPRQYGKSTWLQQQIAETIRRFGPGSAFYLNGDEIRHDRELVERVRELAPLFRRDAPARRLFIDEITAVANWQRGLKVLLDAGELRHLLIVTTGSKAADLRRGAERLPGRKGRLGRTVYLFTPVAFTEFRRVCGTTIEPDHLLPAYLLSGGSPAACAAVATQGRLPEYVIEMTRDWIYGEFAASGRSRTSLLAVMESLYRFGGQPLGQSRLAREANLANNTVAAGYIELLTDLMCVASAFPWDAAHRRANWRLPCKFPFTNLLAAVAWHPRAPRSVADIAALPEGERAVLIEWLVSQELWRRAAVRGSEQPDTMAFWRTFEHEVDFVLGADGARCVDAPGGEASPVDYAWFASAFPGARLTVLSRATFATDRITGLTPEQFLEDGTR